MPETFIPCSSWFYVLSASIPKHLHRWSSESGPSAPLQLWTFWLTLFPTRPRWHAHFLISRASSIFSSSLGILLSAQNLLLLSSNLSSNRSRPRFTPKLRLQDLTIIVSFCPASCGSSPLVSSMYPVLSIYQIKALAANRILWDFSITEIDSTFRATRRIRRNRILGSTCHDSGRFLVAVFIRFVDGHRRLLLPPCFS